MHLLPDIGRDWFTGHTSWRSFEDTVPSMVGHTDNLPCFCIASWNGSALRQFVYIRIDSRVALLAYSLSFIELSGTSNVVCLLILVGSLMVIALGLRWFAKKIAG